MFLGCIDHLTRQTPQKALTNAYYNGLQRVLRPAYGMIYTISLGHGHLSVYRDYVVLEICKA